MGIVLLFSLMLYPIAIGITGLTGGLTVYFRKKLRNAGNLNKDAIGDLRFIAYISLILTFWSIPVYNIAYSLLSGSLSYGCAGISEPVFKIQIGIYIIDAVIKLICYFYAIKIILFAQGMIKISTPKNFVSKKERIAESTSKTATERSEVSDYPLPTYANNCCPSCNARLINGAKFCTQCGGKTDRNNN